MTDHQKKDREKKLLKRHAVETLDGEEDNSGGIDTNLLERRLEGLRDTQESVQGLSLWCQTNKRHSSIIIETWLTILRKSPVEKRLTLFYLANDVIQHAKKKNDMIVVNQWAFAIQKATPHVRTPSSVSAAISRIFKIWEERNIYSKDATADLLALLNNVPAKDRIVENTKPETYTASAEKVSAFQPSMLISKVKQAYRLKSHLGVTFRSKKYVEMDMEGFKHMIRDRNQGLEVIQEISQYLEQLKQSEGKLASEVEERRKVVETAEIGLVFYENVRGESKIVNAAYKNFTTRVMSTKQKVDEKIRAFDEMEGTISPVPSPPAAAPSPPPDEEDFGVRPANKCGGAYSSNSLPPTASYTDTFQHIGPKEIPTEAISTPNSESILSNTSNSLSSYTTPPTANPPVSPYNPNQSNPYQQTMTSMQQQLQQAWSTAGMADTYATMSMSFPNFMQQFQPQTGMPIMSTGYGGVPMQPPPPQPPPYGMDMGYETYQSTPDHPHATPPLPPTDISSIPLPPGPNPPQPPPPPQEAPPPPEAPNPYTMTVEQPPPLPPSGVNPFEAAEYDMSYSHNSNFSSDPSGYNPSGNSNPYDSSQITAPTSDVSSPQSRYHPYNNHSPRGRRISGTNRSMGKMNSNLNNIFPVNNTSPTGSQIPQLLTDLSPMERFSQSLSKSREPSGNNVNVTMNSTTPESPANNPVGDWSTFKQQEGSQSGFMQTQNPYYTNNSFGDFEDGQRLNGSDIGNSTDQYIPQPSNNIFEQASNNIFDTSPQQALYNNRGNIHGGMNHGGARGMKHNMNMNSRGHPRGGGGGRGFSGGFRGTRGGGAGMVRGAGPPRGGGRGRF